MRNVVAENKTVAGAEGNMGIKLSGVSGFVLLTLSAIFPAATAQQHFDSSPARSPGRWSADEASGQTQSQVSALTREGLVNFTISGTVTKIDDGDSIGIEGVGGARFIIRMSDIDTPEISHQAFTPRDCPCSPLPYRPGQSGGQAAKQSLTQLVSVGGKVRAECYEMDQYGRAVCHVFNGPVNLNLEQIKRGWGWTPSRSQWIRDPDSKPAEVAARSAKLGAWGLANQVSPDIWRRDCWRNGNCEGAEN